MTAKLNGLVFVSDLHLTWDPPVARLDDIVETESAKFRELLTFAKTKGCAVIVAGDFFHRPRNWLLLLKILSIIQDFPEVPIFSVYGQHDMYLYSDNRSGTNLGVLIAVGLVKELTGCRSDLVVNDLRVGIFGSSWGVGVPTTVPNRGYLNILVSHVSVGAKEIYEGQPGFVQCTKFLDNNPQYNLIHVGDIHQQFMVIKGDRAIINPGPMLRLTADASSFSHSPGFFVSFPEEVNNKVKLNLQFIRYTSAQPGKQVLSRDHLLLEKNRNAFLADFVSGIKNSDGMNSTDFFLILKEVVEEAKASPEVRKIISELATKERVVR